MNETCLYFMCSFVFQRSGETVQLNEFDGIDILGNMIEAAPLLSPNIDYYGQLHNMGHVFVGMIHDPDGRHLVNSIL